MGGCFWPMYLPYVLHALACSFRGRMEIKNVTVCRVASAICGKNMPYSLVVSLSMGRRRGPSVQIDKPRSMDLPCISPSSSSSSSSSSSFLREMDRVVVGHRPEEHPLSLAFYGFGILSIIAGVLQFIPHDHVTPIAICVSISLVAFTALIALAPPYYCILARISFFFAILASASLLSPVVPSKIGWAPYLSCIFASLHLLSSSSRRSLQQLCWKSWNSAGDALSRVHRAVSSRIKRPNQVSSMQSSTVAGPASHGPDGSPLSPVAVEEEKGWWEYEWQL